MKVRGSRDERAFGRAPARTRRAARFARGWRLLLTGGTLGALAACSLVVDAGRKQCTTDAQCISHLGSNAVCIAGGVCQVQTPQLPPVVDSGGDVSVDAAPPDPAWACVESAQILPAGQVHVYARYRRFADGTPLADLSVSGCSAFGVCSPPAPGTPKPTDSSGLFDMLSTSSVPSGFRGTLETSASEAFPKLLPSVLAVPAGETNVQSLEPADADPDAGRPRRPTDLLTSDDLQALADALDAKDKVTINPDLGHVSFTALNCQLDLVADVAVSSDVQVGETRLIYLDENGKPSAALKKTSSSARGVFLNLPVGNATISFDRGAGAKSIAQTVGSRKGAVTYLFLGPAR